MSGEIAFHATVESSFHTDTLIGFQCHGCKGDVRWKEQKSRDGQADPECFMGTCCDIEYRAWVDRWRVTVIAPQEASPAS